MPDSQKVKTKVCLSMKDKVLENLVPELLKLIIDGSALVLLPPGRGQRDGGGVRGQQRDSVLLVQNNSGRHGQDR